MPPKSRAKPNKVQKSKKSCKSQSCARCTQRTAKGLKCKNKTCNVNSVCRVHTPKFENERKDERKQERKEKEVQIQLLRSKQKVQKRSKTKKAILQSQKLKNIQKTKNQKNRQQIPSVIDLTNDGNEEKENGKEAEEIKIGKQKVKKKKPKPKAKLKKKKQTKNTPNQQKTRFPLISPFYKELLVKLRSSPLVMGSTNSIQTRYLIQIFNEFFPITNQDGFFVFGCGLCDVNVFVQEQFHPKINVGIERDESLALESQKYVRENKLPIRILHQDIKELQRLPQGTTICYSFDGVMLASDFGVYEALVDECPTVKYIVSTKSQRKKEKYWQQSKAFTYKLIGQKRAAMVISKETFTFYVYKKDMISL